MADAVKIKREHVQKLLQNNSKTVCIILSVTIALLGCSQSHFIFPQDEKGVNQTLLDEKDLQKNIIVTFKDGSKKSGVLLSFTERSITISEKWTGASLDIPYDVIAKIEIVENRYWPIVLASILIIWTIIMKAAIAYSEAISSLGA